MVPALYPDHLLRFGDRIKNFLQLRARAVLVARATDKQLWLGALRKKLVAVQTFVHLHRRSQRDKRDYAFIWTGRPQPSRRAKRKSRKDDGQMEFGVQPIQSGLHVLDFAAPLVVRAFAQAGAAKI